MTSFATIFHVPRRWMTPSSSPPPRRARRLSSAILPNGNKEKKLFLVQKLPPAQLQKRQDGIWTGERRDMRGGGSLTNALHPLHVLGLCRVRTDSFQTTQAVAKGSQILDLVPWQRGSGIHIGHGVIISCVPPLHRVRRSGKKKVKDEEEGR